MTKSVPNRPYALEFLLLSLASLLTISKAFYLPGVNPRTFSNGDEIPLHVNSLTSVKTLLPLDYYSFPFCRHPDGLRHSNQNLGESLAGNRITNSPFRIRMKEDMACEQLCAVDLGEEGKNTVHQAIQQKYHNNWIMDNMDAATKLEDDTVVRTSYWQGFPLGFTVEEFKQTFVYNHFNIELTFHETESEPDHYRLVRFLVEPFTIRHHFNPPNDDQTTKPKIINPIRSCVEGSLDHTRYEHIREAQPAHGWVLFTYDVIWKRSYSVHWSERWNIYLTMDNAVPARVHWYSITNSLIVVLASAVTLLAIYIRELRNLNSARHAGWKALRGDVFRPPMFNPGLLAVGCGTGAHIVSTSLLVIIFASLGFMNPARRGHLLLGSLLVFAVMGSVAGYVSARFYKLFKPGALPAETAWVTFQTGLFFPGLCFAVFLMTNMVARHYESTSAVPFSTTTILVSLWCFICLPLTFLGAGLGYRKDATPFPVHTTESYRPIPPRSWRPIALTAIGSASVFACCYVETFFLMTATWMGFHYYVFGSLLVVFVLAIATCAEFGIVSNYRLLRCEDYRWWWFSFVGSGSASIWLFLYSWIYSRQFHSDLWGTYMIYFGYMALVSLAFFLGAGYIGVSAALWFNRLLYGTLGAVDGIQEHEMGVVHSAPSSDQEAEEGGEYTRLEDSAEPAPSTRGMGWFANRLFAAAGATQDPLYHQVGTDLQLHESNEEANPGEALPAVS